MTGAYLRVKRDGKWENVEVEHLTDEERSECISESMCLSWLHMVCNKLASVESLLDELERDGIIARREKV